MDKYKEELVKMLITASKDQSLFKALIADILTPAEYNLLAKRWQIIKRLEKGENQRSIAQDLKIGIATVTRGSRELQNPNGGFRKLIKKLRK